MVDALNQRTEYGYDEPSNKVSQTDAGDRTTTWAYDNAGRVVSRTLPEGQIETFSYDDAGNRTGHVDFNGASHTFGYDALNREVSASYADGTTVTIAYTDSGQLESVTDDRGTTSYLYDDRDRLTRITYPTGRIVNYGYDAAGNRTSLSTVNQLVSYTFDALNRLATVTDEVGTATYGYDAVGNRASVDYPNGTRTEYEYDEQNRLLSLSQYDPQDALFAQHTYTLGPNGNRLQHAELSGRTIDYGYDDLYRLTSETVTDPTIGDRTTTFTYDTVGNRLSQTETTAAGTTTTTYVYDLNDRLTTETSTGADPATRSYTYDNNGNTLSRTDGGTTTTYGWDSRNRLIDLNAGQVTYRYDAAGIRMSETAAGLTTNYLVDPNRSYAQVIEESFDLNSFADVRYSYGDDLPHQHRRIDQSTTESRTFHYDGIGSTRQLTDTTGSVTDSYAFEAFGELEGQSGITTTDFLYTGEQWDPNLGFYYLRARYYDPNVGRFGTMDSYQGRQFEPITFHKYLYANVRPQEIVDPHGLFGISEAAVTVNIVNVLTSLQIENGFRVFDDLGVQDSRIDNARTINRIWALANVGAAGVRIWRLLSGRFSSKANNLARQVGESRALVFINRSASSQIARRGHLTRRDLESFIPPGTPNSFRPSNRLPSGARYNFVVDGNKIEIWWHPRNPTAPFGSASSLGWTARIRRNGEFLGADGNWYRTMTNRELALTHIPFVD